MTQEPGRDLNAVPKTYQKFANKHGQILGAYDALNAKVKALNALSPEEMALVKLAISVGAGMDGAMASQTRKAIKAGIDPKKIEQVAIMALPTLGLPRMMQAWKTIGSILDKT